MFKVSRTNRTILRDMLQQQLNIVRMFRHPCLVILPAHIIGRQHAVAHQGKVATGQETGFMSPVFHQLPAAQGVLQPALRIATKTTKKHKIGAAGNDVDGIDLQQGHLLNSLQNIAGAGTSPGLLQQSLRRKVEMTGFFKRQL